MNVMYIIVIIIPLIFLLWANMWFTPGARPLVLNCKRKMNKK